jgi:hypothetical protein
MGLCHLLNFESSHLFLSCFHNLSHFVAEAMVHFHVEGKYSFAMLVGDFRVVQMIYLYRIMSLCNVSILTWFSSHIEGCCICRKQSHHWFHLSSSILWHSRIALDG